MTTIAVTKTGDFIVTNPAGQFVVWKRGFVAQMLKCPLHGFNAAYARGKRQLRFSHLQMRSLITTFEWAFSVGLTHEDCTGSWS